MRPQHLCWDFWVLLNCLIKNVLAVFIERGVQRVLAIGSFEKRLNALVHQHIHIRNVIALMKTSLFAACNRVAAGDRVFTIYGIT